MFPGCQAQIPEYTESNYAPCCFFDNISLCATCSAKQRIQCPHCPNAIGIKNRHGYIRLEKIAADHHRHDPVADPVAGRGANHFDDPVADRFDDPAGPDNPVNPRSYASSFSGIAMVGSATMTLWLCASAWKKYCLRNELDAIGQHAKKLMEERCVYYYKPDELSLAIDDQFNIPDLLNNMKEYISPVVNLG